MPPAPSTSTKIIYRRNFCSIFASKDSLPDRLNQLMTIHLFNIHLAGSKDQNVCRGDAVQNKRFHTCLPPRLRTQDHIQANCLFKFSTPLLSLLFILFLNFISYHPSLACRLPPPTPAPSPSPRAHTGIPWLALVFVFISIFNKWPKYSIRTNAILKIIFKTR